MGTYMALIDVNEPQIQNAQELAAIWGDIRNDIDEIGGTLHDSYAILGERDFLALFEADGRNTAMQISIRMESYGLDTQTMELVPEEEFGELVEDI